MGRTIGSDMGKVAQENIHEARLAGDLLVDQAERVSRAMEACFVVGAVYASLVTRQTCRMFGIEVGNAQ